MQNILINLKKEIFPLSLILILIISRLIPHPPNFTPIISVAIISSYFFKDKFLSILVLMISMILSDFLIGFHKNIFFVYLSLVTITLVFYNLREKINFKSMFLFGFFGSLIFYLISNFGVWILGTMYEKNFSGLLNCYIMAIPFFKNTFLSTLFFSYAVLVVDSLYRKKFI